MKPTSRSRLGLQLSRLVSIPAITPAFNCCISAVLLADGVLHSAAVVSCSRSVQYALSVLDSHRGTGTIGCYVTKEEQTYTWRV